MSYPEGSSALAKALDSCRRWCIPQGPLDIIIQQNPFMGMEDHNYWQVVERAAHYKGLKPYLTLDEYNNHYRSGRIDGFDIHRVIFTELDRTKKPDITFIVGSRTYERSSLWTKIIWLPRVDHTRASLRKVFGPKHWDFIELISEKMKALNISLPQNLEAKFARHRDLTKSEQILVSLLQVYFDQGISRWRFPDRESGFFNAFKHMTQTGDQYLPQSLRWSHSSEMFLKNEFSQLESLLKQFGLKEDQYEEALVCELFSLHGWISMAAKLEREPHRATHIQIHISLAQVLAVKLWLKHNFHEPLAFCCDPKQIREDEATLWPSFVAEVYHLIQRLGVPLKDLQNMSLVNWELLFEEIKSFPEINRRRLLHKAFERNYRKKALQDLAGSALAQKPKKSKDRPQVQMFFCLDAREESFRRHLEAVEPNVETFGVAGFFGIDMLWQSFGETKSVPYCPVVMTPKTTIREVLHQKHGHLAHKRGKQIRRTKLLSRSFYEWSRSALLGWLLHVTTGVFAFIPMFFRILFPRWSGKIKHSFWEFFLPHLETELELVRTGERNRDDETLGFTYEEMANRLEGVLKTVGLTSNFAPLVVIAGHGSTCYNNPYKSAYECGACGGRHGGHNARAFAQMANLNEVRDILSERGVHIHQDVWFVGAYHDTAEDRVDFFDTSSIPETHEHQFEIFEETLLEVRKRNAAERCRRFEEAKGLSPESALKHVETRAQSLAEPRPEYGNASNAICVVGRREWTMSLCLDRRSFLASYDFEADPSGDLLVKLMSAISPVVEGINLQYTFSALDPKGIGSGTKLPHNVVGLIGIMNGGRDDLQTGFASQMVEIHEPMRLLVVIEATKAQVELAFQTVHHLHKVVTNEWMQLAYYDPLVKSLYQYKPGGFVLRTSEGEPTRSARV